MRTTARIKAALLMLSFVLVSGCGSSTGSAQPAELAGFVSPASSTVPPLDDIPGLGRSAEGVQRDEVISYWEAWRRDTLVSDCMSAAGFRWIPEVHYPESEILAIAAALNVQPDTGRNVRSPLSVNRSYVATLLPDQNEAYHQALYGESAADIAHWTANEGAPPPGAGPDFAESGCRAAGWEQVGTIWDLKEVLAEDLADMAKRAQATPQFAAALPAYTGCLAGHGFAGVTHPGDLERQALDGAADVSAYAVADRDCNEHWVAANTAGVRGLEDDFRARNQALLHAQTAKYSQAYQAAAADSAFLAALSVAADRAAGGS